MRFAAILERVLRAYHGDERHGGADRIGDRILDAELVPVAREAFRLADDMPADDEVLGILRRDELRLLGEGYHVMTLEDPTGRFVVKYAKSPEPVPPLAPAREQPRPEEWTHDHGVRPDGSLHEAIWQHVRSFEAYGVLGVPNRVYIADAAHARLAADQRRRLERFRSIGIVRSLGSEPLTLRIRYADDVPGGKRAPDGVGVAVLVVQPRVTTLEDAIAREVRAGNASAARRLEERYTRFLEDLWRHGVPHLDFSLLNVGLRRVGDAERLQIFDPHLGIIEVADGRREVKDPLAERTAHERSVEDVLRAARDGSRWALWQVQQDASASPDVPEESAEEAARIVREFHVASAGIDGGHGAFSVGRFERTWQQRGAHGINAVVHAELSALVTLPLCRLIQSVLEAPGTDAIYDRMLPILGMSNDRVLTQFCAGLKAHGDKPVIVIANVSEDAPRLVKHWGRIRFPPELDVQDDPAIHYHLRDLFTGETWVRSGEDLVRGGFVVGLAPYEIHALEVEDVVVNDLAVERAIAAHRDVSELLPHCTKRMGVVGDVHGELDALKEVLLALGFVDASGQWLARDGTLVFTGDVGHGKHLQEVFDFIHRLAGEAHRAGGRIVWTLGNHDLYVDGEGGQGGERSLGYRLWPTIREAALHPERHPGLLVRAAYFDHDKVFVHGGILPNIVDVAVREHGARDASEIASWVNDVFRRALVDRERISSRDLPHEIFRTGTSHARHPRLPGDVGYEPAGVFTPDLREVDHYRYAGGLLPQVIGHTASKNGAIRYSPASWLRRDYIAVDVGRQHGTGNGGLLLTDFGWVAVTPGGPARLVEVGPLFVRLAHEATASVPEERDDAASNQLLASYFRSATSDERAAPNTRRHGRLFELSPAQLVALERLLGTVGRTGRCTIVTDLDDMLTAFLGGDLEHGVIQVLADYLAAGGVFVFATGAPFAWCYYRVLRPLVGALGPRSRLLANVLLVLTGGREVYVFHDGAYRLASESAGKDKADGFDALVRLSREGRVGGIPEIDPGAAAYVANSWGMDGLDRAIAGRVGIVIDVCDAMVGLRGRSVITLHRGHLRTVDLIAAATTALKESGGATLHESPPEVGETELWTFGRKNFPLGCRIRVRVGASGYVHAGVARADGTWDPVYNVPLAPRPDGHYEAVLPSGVDRFTFFWTEPPHMPGHPGHWERGRDGGRVFEPTLVE